MLPSKIGLTDQIINAIKTARTSKRFPAAVLSKAIQRDNSYISSLELGRLQTISSFDLITIFRTLYSITEPEAVTMIEQLLSTNTISDGSAMVNEIKYEYKTNCLNNNQTKPELISDMLDIMTELLIKAYYKNPKEAVFALKCFIETIQVNSDFATEVMSMPFYALKSISTDEQKEILDKIKKIVDEYS